MNVVIDTPELGKVVQQLASARREIDLAAQKTLFDFAAKVVRTAVTTYRSAPTTTPIATRRRTGDLARSYTFTAPKFENDAVTTHIGVLQAAAQGNVLAYARGHEYGATIPAAPGKFLTIPLKAAMTARGVTRAPAREWEDTFVIRSKRGNLIIMQRRAKGAVPLFYLRPRDTPLQIKARPAIVPTIAGMIDEYTQALGDATVRAIFKREVSH